MAQPKLQAQTPEATPTDEPSRRPPLLAQVEAQIIDLIKTGKVAAERADVADGGQVLHTTAHPLPPRRAVGPGALAQ